jgi:hypothetical protein
VSAHILIHDVEYLTFVQEEYFQVTHAKRKGNAFSAIGSHSSNLFLVLSDDATTNIEGEQQVQQVLIQPATFSLPNSMTIINDDSDL